MLTHRHPTTVAGSVNTAGWTTRIRFAAPALFLSITAAASQAAPTTRPAALEAEVPPAPALVAEVETVDEGAVPAAAPRRAVPTTRPAEATARDREDSRPASDRPVRRRLVGNPADPRDLSEYLYASTERAADDPYRLTDPMLYMIPWGHPVPPPYPPPPLPSRNGYGYGGSWYESSGGSRHHAVQPGDGNGGAPVTPPGGVRAVSRFRPGPSRPGGGSGGASAGAPRPVRFPPGAEIPRARPPRPPGT